MKAIRWGTLAGLLAMPIMTLTSTAHAATDTDPETDVQEIVITQNTIAEARADDNPEGELPAAEQRKLAKDLVADAASSGTYLDADSVDVVPLLDGQVQLAVPVDTEVQSIKLEPTGHGNDVAVTMDGAGIDEGSVMTSGPEMASGWADDGGPWNYRLYLYIDGQRMADADFHARRWIAKNDGSSRLNYVRYERWGGAQVYGLRGLPDPSLKRLRIQNFPHDSVEPNLRDWVKYSPGADLPDVNKCTNYSTGFSWQGVSVSRSFDRCDRYNMWRNVDKPSSYWLQWEGSSKGNREVAYSLLWSQKQGTARSQHDLQRMVLSWPSWAMTADSSCTQTDASRTCKL